MKKLTQFFLLLSLALSCSFCSNKNYTPADYPKGQIIFGNGGGMAGSVTEYTLLENGALFTKKGMNAENTALKKIESKVVKQLFNNIEFLNLNEVQLNQPGNRYYFMEFKGKNKDHKIVWGGAPMGPPKEIKNFYNILNHLLKE